MAEDEKIQTAINEAVDILRKAAPDAPFILIHVSGIKKEYGARYFSGAAKQVNTAIKNTMIHTALHCADGLNSLIKQLADIVPGARKVIAPTPKVAVALLEEAIVNIKNKEKMK